jgi:hypothetical protein
MTSQLIYQRIRNRVIEELEALIESENLAPRVGMNAVVNSFEDWIPIPMPNGYFPPPVFTIQENDLLHELSTAMEAFCAATPRTIEDDVSALALPQWKNVVTAAKSSLSAMLVRGKMPEDTELRL